MQQSNPSFHSLDFMLAHLSTPPKNGMHFILNESTAPLANVLQAQAIHEDLSMQQCSTPMIFGLLPPRKTCDFLFFSSTALVLFDVLDLLLNGHLTKGNHDARNVERMKLLFVAGNSGVFVSSTVFFSTFLDVLR